MNLLDSSVLIAALVPDENKHVESLAILMRAGNAIYSHAILETFSTLTGGRLGVRVDADLAARLLKETILPRVEVIELDHKELMASLHEAKQRGIRGGAVYDFMHLAAAKKAGAQSLYTINLSDFRHLSRAGDPEVRCP